MTTRHIIRTRPGAGFITIIASLLILNILVLAAGCSSDRKTASSARQSCASDNGGLTLPDGFCATVFADSVGGKAARRTNAANGRRTAVAGAAGCCRRLGLVAESHLKPNRRSVRVCGGLPFRCPDDPPSLSSARAGAVSGFR